MLTIGKINMIRYAQHVAHDEAHRAMRPYSRLYSQVGLWLQRGLFVA